MRDQPSPAGSPGHSASGTEMAAKGHPADADYVLGRDHQEYERLIQQAMLINPLTERVLRASGVQRGMRVLDVGCGVGDVTFLARRMVGRTGWVIGIDVDDRALERAEQRRKQRGYSNVSFVRGDVRDTQFDQSFDAAVGRMTLMYLADPCDALRRIAEQVRPGGVVAFHEWTAAGATITDSLTPALARLQQLIVSTLVRAGAHSDVGLKLYDYMLEVGLEPDPHPIAEIGLTTDQEAGIARWSGFIPSLMPSIIKYGFGDQESTSRLLRELVTEIGASGSCVPVTWPMTGQWARVPRAQH